MAHIEQDANQLATEMRDLPPHHRSVWALFDYSWHLLAEHEKEVLAQCSVFAGGFRLEAATVIAQATETDLTNLVHHSLLAQDENGRYNIHPLVQQFAQHKQTELTQAHNQIAATQQRHRRYYLQTCFVDYAEIWNTPLLALQAELNNKRLAWQNAIRAHDFALLAEAAESWGAYWDRLSVYIEGIDTLKAALQTIHQELPSLPNHAEWVAALQVELAGLLTFTGSYQESYDLAEAVLSMSTAPRILGLAYHWQCHVLWSTGFTDKAEALLEKMSFFEDKSNTFDYMNLLHLKATIFGLQGKEVEAKALIAEALTLAEQHHYVREKIMMLNNLGVEYQFEGQRYQAIHYYQQGYETAVSIDYLRGKAYLVSNLVPTYTQLGLYKEATRCVQEGFLISQNLGDKHLRAEFFVYRAFLYNATQHYDDAIEDAQVAMAGFIEVESLLSMVLAYRALGDAWLGKEEWAEAEAVYQELVAHCEPLDLPEGMVEPLSGLAFIACQQGDKVQMRERVERTLAILPTLILSHESIGNIMDVYWRCYVVLDHLGDERAAGVLQTAVSQLQAQADQITDSTVRQQFLDNIQSHRNLLKAASTPTLPNR